MIISASYRTDIPAFFGDWFAERWAEGFCEVPNPYNKKLYRVSLNPAEIDAMVFWTRAAKPFRKQFEMVREAGVPFFVTYTITGYGNPLEAGVPDWQVGMEALHDLGQTYGPDAVVWRYDPILLSDSMPESWHLENFAKLANAAKGATNEVIVSFAQFYAKANRGLKAVNVTAHDPNVETKQAMLCKLASLAANNGMTLSLCAQPELLVPEVKNASCIDVQRLWRVAAGMGKDPFKAKLKPHRPNCACAESRDIGTFATCKFGCAYCYAKA